MDAGGGAGGNNFNIRGGVAYPVDPHVHQEGIEAGAIRMLQDQIREATGRLENPTRQAVEGVVRHHITTMQSTCGVALTLMADFLLYDALAETIREEVLGEQEVPMPQPLGPERDPVNDPAMADDAEMQAADEEEEEDPEEDPEEEEEPEDDDDDDFLMGLQIQGEIPVVWGEDPGTDDEEPEEDQQIPEMFGDNWEFEPIEGFEPEEPPVVLVDLEGAPEPDSDSDSEPKYSPTSPDYNPFSSYSPLNFSP